MKNIKYLSGLLLIAACLTAKTQNYETSLGIRLDVDNFGITGKQFIETHSALEGIVQFKRKGIVLAGLYEYHDILLKDEKNLRWFAGGGGHLGVLYSNWNNKVAIGIDGIVGIEYTFESAPFNFSIDFQPAVNLIEDYEIWYGMGLSGRYIFKY